MRIGALEAGGTKMVCAIGTEEGVILDRMSVPTQTPEITMPILIEYFKKQEIEALGVGSFGPVDLRKKSSTYGYITTTPKLAWQNFDLLGTIRKELDIPIGFDTDVNAAALGEATFGSTKGLDSSIYITIGTGVGVGIYMDGSLVHGMLHPEAGHILLMKHKEDTYKGRCPFHPCCLESLASGPAIEERYGVKAEQLADRKDVWELEAYYIAQALVNFTLTISPQRIVLGGGVMHQKQLFPFIREQFSKLLNGYIKTKELEDLEQFIVSPNLNDNQAVLGCIQLALLEIETLSK